MEPELFTVGKMVVTVWLKLNKTISVNEAQSRQTRTLGLICDRGDSTRTFCWIESGPFIFIL